MSGAGGAAGTRRRRGGGFRRRDARAVYDLHFGPNMTPMVDVVLVILIFFMAAAAFLGPERLLRAGVAEEGAAATAEALRAGESAGVFDLEPPVLLVVVRRDGGRVVVDAFGETGVGVALFAEVADRVAGELRSAGALSGDADGDVAVAIEVGAGVAYGDAVAVHDALTAAGFVRVGLR
ncbi:MAG: biopolymer transporter ExbD [Planctomycetota bacterium]